MSDPYTWVAIGTFVVKATGSIADANSGAGQYRAQAEAETENAKALRASAQAARLQGSQNEQQARREYRDLAGAQAAAIAESGIANGGSVLDVFRDSEVKASLDALKLRYQGEQKAQGLDYEANLATMRSTLARDMAKRAKARGYLNIAGDALSSFGGMGGGAGGMFGGAGKGAIGGMGAGGGVIPSGTSGLV